MRDPRNAKAEFRFRMSTGLTRDATPIRRPSGADLDESSTWRGRIPFLDAGLRDTSPVPRCAAARGLLCVTTRRTAVGIRVAWNVLA
jgi:hypothetical protein